MKKYLILLLLLLPSLAFGAMPVNPSYVSADGSGSTCTLVSPCALSYANTNADAGDIVILRGGTYTNQGINPSNSGSEGDVITFRNYTGETVTFTGTPDALYGININGKSLIRVTGDAANNILFTDVARWMQIGNGSHYNEVSYCTFSNTTDTAIKTNVTAYITGYCNDGTNYNCPSTHNWFHHNTLHSAGNPGWAEGRGLMQVGTASAGDQTSNNNTVENNLFYHGGHHLLDIFTMYTVVRNNVGHNEGWKTAVAPMEVTVSIANPAVVSKVGHGLSVGNIVVFKTTGALPTGLTKDTGYYFIIAAGFTSDQFQISATDDGAAIGTSGSQSGTHTITPRYAPDPVGNYPGNNKYGHRAFSSEEEAGRSVVYNLLEGNRIGYASINPDNNGADGVTWTMPGSILRYNAIYGSDGPGIYLKNGAQAANNRIYNNTIYKNGQYTGDCAVANYAACDTAPPLLNAIAITLLSDGNHIKNNLLWQNGTADFSCTGGGCSLANQTYANNWCDAVDAEVTKCSGAADPKFVNPDITDMTSLTLPDLRLQSTSGAKNGGTYLTVVAAGDEGSGTSLKVEDALYFQAGSAGTTTPMGASISSVTGDVILVGATVGAADEVTITGINYATNTITCADFTRVAGDKVWLKKKSDGATVLYGTAPDMGAYEREIDETAPTTTISTVAQTVTASSLSVVGTASDAVGVSSCKWRLASAPDGSNGSACTGTTSWTCAVTGLSSGANTVYVGCTDAAANWGAGDNVVITYNDTTAAPITLGTGATWKWGTGASVKVQ